MFDEFQEGVDEGRYIFLDRAWAIPEQWHGALVAFRACGEKFGIVSRSTGAWRCCIGYLEPNGMYGKAWWERTRDMIVADLDEGLSHIQAFFAEAEDA